MDDGYCLFVPVAPVRMLTVNHPLSPLLLLSELNLFTSKLQSCSHKSVGSERYFEERCSPLTPPICPYIVITPSPLFYIFF